MTHKRVALVDEVLAYIVFQQLDIRVDSEPLVQLEPWKLLENALLFNVAYLKIQTVLKQPYSIIAAVSYWGFPFAVLLASKSVSACRVCCLDDRMYDSSNCKDEQSVLLVDDALKTGNSLNSAIQRLESHNMSASQYLCILDVDTIPGTENRESLPSDLDMFALTRASLGQ